MKIIIFQVKRNAFNAVTKLRINLKNTPWCSPLEGAEDLFLNGTFIPIVETHT